MSRHFDEAAKDWDNEPRRVALMKAIGKAILREAEPTSDMDVLDYGCGTGLRLIGGMSWESSIEYYRIINETVKERLGGLRSVDFPDDNSGQD